MADNAFVKIGTALLKHQVKKLVGEEAMGAIGEELADIGGDKLDAWLGDKSTIAEIEKAAGTARDLFRGKVNDDEVEQWMVMLPIHDLPAVLSAIEELPKSPDETKLENALRESIALNWKRLSPVQVDNAVNAFLSALRSALLPIEKQTLMVIGRSVLRTEDKIDQLTKLVEQLKPYASDGQSNISIGRLNIGGNVGGSVVIGNNNTVNQTTNNYYQHIVEKNTKQNDSDYWNLKHPYPMPPNFTGRVVERIMLTQWLNADSDNRLFILRALGGFGKSALTWHWLTHDVDPNQWPKVVFWSFYEGDASFENFIAETLLYLKLEVPRGQRQQVVEVLNAMMSQKILLIMDGFERALRAFNSMNAAYQGDGERELEEKDYDCVSLYAEDFLKTVCSSSNIKSKILMTTRLTPRAVKVRGEFMLGCHEEEVTAMQREDAVIFFHKQNIEGTHTEIETICAAYGFHPLSLRLLAGLISDNRRNPGDIRVAKQWDITEDIIQNRHHILEQAFNALSSSQHNLLGDLACLRNIVDYELLEKLNDGQETLDSDLKSLESRGLLHWDRKNNKYDLHPIVRKYVYARLTDSKRSDAHAKMRDYFSALGPSVKIESLVDLANVIERYHHTVRVGEFERALDLYHNLLAKYIYYQFGAYQIEIELLSSLFSSHEEYLLHIKRPKAQIWVLNSIATSYSLSGQPHRAIQIMELANTIEEKTSEGMGVVIGLGNLAQDQLSVGKISQAYKNLKKEIELSRLSYNNYQIAIGIQELGRLLAYCGMWRDSENELKNAENIYLSNKDVREGETDLYSGICAYLALMEILKCRDQNLSKVINNNSAIKYAQLSLDAANKTARARHHFERDFIRSQWLIGYAYYINGKADFAENHLTEALNRCRHINLIESEADILLSFVYLRYMQKNFEESKSLAEEALVITERSGYVLQGADVNLFLAQYALEQERDKAKAKQYAESALKLAYCDGPPYYYKVAYEEAERMLKELK